MSVWMLPSLSKSVRWVRCTWVFSILAMWQSFFYKMKTDTYFLFFALRQFELSGNSACISLSASVRAAKLCMRCIFFLPLCTMQGGWAESTLLSDLAITRPCEHFCERQRWCWFYSLSLPVVAVQELSQQAVPKLRCGIFARKWIWCVSRSSRALGVCVCSSGKCFAFVDPPSSPESFNVFRIRGPCTTSVPF